MDNGDDGCSFLDAEAASPAEKVRSLLCGQAERCGRKGGLGAQSRTF